MKAHESIHRYEAGLPPGLARVARLLRSEIERALPGASSKVWHGHPVWFDGENPVVGYDARRATVNLLFWNGQALGEPGLVPVGKHRAAGKELRTVADIDRTELRRWLEKARINVLDSAALVRELREAAKRSEQAVAAGPKDGREGHR